MKPSKNLILIVIFTLIAVFQIALSIYREQQEKDAINREAAKKQRLDNDDFIKAEILLDETIKAENKTNKIRVKQLAAKSESLSKNVDMENETNIELQVNTVGEKITSHRFKNNSNGLITSLEFLSADGYFGRLGAMVLTNNASGGCRYVYSYNVNGSDIKAVFVNSDCGANSPNQTFRYDINSNTIDCYIGGNKFVFN